ncbi:MAG: PaaI family thioesterase [Gammaproteobacteria bacterium]|nr:MAG: PaaI family thioesterase [Gammaproteobacteria bacterium]
MGQLGSRVEQLGDGTVRVRLPFHEDFLRPGGTVQGPVLMGLADLALYAIVLSLIGPVELAVTTNLNCNFLRRPLPGDIIAEGRILKLGKRLAVGEVSLYSDGDPEMVAHVTATYSIPPDHAEPLEE